MDDLTTISQRLHNVLKELERVTDDIDTIQMQMESVANDDFLTRDTDKTKKDV